METNYHTHTYRCNHAKGSDQQFVEAAIDAGLQLLGFADHMPFPKEFPDGDRMSLNEFPNYLASLESLKIKYQDKITILSGLECEWIPENQEHLRYLRKQCDFLIFGNHERLIVNDHYDYTFYSNDEAIERYCLASREALSSGLFLYFAHPDYFMFGRRSFNDTCAWAAEYLAQLSVEFDIPLEININGFTRKHYVNGIWQAPYPYPEFWKIVSKYPVKVIYGLDAHRPIHLFRADMINEVNEHLGNLNFTVVDRL